MNRLEGRQSKRFGKYFGHDSSTRKETAGVEVNIKLNQKTLKDA